MRRLGLAVVAAVVIAPAATGAAYASVSLGPGDIPHPEVVGRDLGPSAAPSDAYPSTAQRSQGLPEDCIPHSPIRIEGDEMFRMGPAVGVVNPEAAGTAEDPFLIEGWCILPVTRAIEDYRHDVESAGIAIHHTDAHVVIQDNHVDGERQLGWRISQQVGIDLTNADNVTVKDNTLQRSRYGVATDWSDDVDVVGNDFTENVHGVTAYRSDEPRIAGNTFQQQAGTAIIAARSDGARISQNRIEDGGKAIRMSSTVDASIEGNEIVDNGFGVSVSTDSQANVTRNNIEGNGVGLEAGAEGSPVNATRNWWGADAGPSGRDVEDACTGTVATEGPGDEIRPGGAGVCFDPWLMEPNPDAGAG